MPSHFTIMDWKVFAGIISPEMLLQGYPFLISIRGTEIVFSFGATRTGLSDLGHKGGLP